MTLFQGAVLGVVGTVGFLFVVVGMYISFSTFVVGFLLWELSLFYLLLLFPESKILGKEKEDLIIRLAMVSAVITVANTVLGRPASARELIVYAAVLVIIGGLWLGLKIKHQWLSKSD